MFLQYATVRLHFIYCYLQSLHLETVFAAGRQLGFCPPHVKTDHAAFGVVLGEDKYVFHFKFPCAIIDSMY